MIIKTIMITIVMMITITISSDDDNNDNISIVTTLATTIIINKNISHCNGSKEEETEKKLQTSAVLPWHLNSKNERRTKTLSLSWVGCHFYGCREMAVQMPAYTFFFLSFFLG